MMKLDFIPTRRLGCVLAFAAILPVAPSSAATINTSPVTVTHLTHEASSDGWVRDAVGFPEVECGRGCCYWIVDCPGVDYTTQLFTATIAAGDVVTLKIQAPPGKKFVVHPVAGKGHFFATAYWMSGPGDGAWNDHPASVTFENLLGTPPTETYSFTFIGDQRHSISIHKNYTYTAAFEFTAYRVQMTATGAVPPAQYKYDVFGGWSDPSFGVSAQGVDPEGPLMEIVDLATPVERASWGRIKSLYR